MDEVYCNMVGKWVGSGDKRQLPRELGTFRGITDEMRRQGFDCDYSVN